MTDASDQVSNGYVASGLRFFTCDRCKKLSRCSNIVWAHDNQITSVEMLEVRPGGQHPIKLFICPACMDSFETMYREWLEKKP